MGDWRSREGLVKGEYASDVEFLGWLPGCTRHTVTIDLGEEQGIQNDRGQQTLINCKSSVGRVNTCTHSELNYKASSPLRAEKQIKGCTYKCIFLV